MRQKRFCITYCFLSLQENRHEKTKKKLSRRSLLQHAIVSPHQRQQKSNSHANTGLPLYQTQIRKKTSKLASQTPNNVRKDVSDNTDVTRRKHQTQLEKLRGKRKLSIKVSECTLWVSRQCKTRAHFCFFGSFFTFCSVKNFFYLLLYSCHVHEINRRWISCQNISGAVVSHLNATTKGITFGPQCWTAIRGKQRYDNKEKTKF